MSKVSVLFIIYENSIFPMINIPYDLRYWSGEGEDWSVQRKQHARDSVSNENMYFSDFLNPQRVIQIPNHHMTTKINIFLDLLDLSNVWHQN